MGLAARPDTGHDDADRNPQGHPWLSTIYQPLLDQTLREALDKHPGVEVRLGQELTALTEAGDGIQMTFRQTDGSLGKAHARL